MTRHNYVLLCYACVLQLCNVHAGLAAWALALGPVGCSLWALAQAGWCIARLPDGYFLLLTYVLLD